MNILIKTCSGRWCSGGVLVAISNLDWMDEYIANLNGIASEAMQRGLSGEEVGRIPIPTAYQDLIFPKFFLANLNFLVKRMAKPPERRCFFLRLVTVLYLIQEIKHVSQK